jgi:hypothetical protein
MQIGEHYYIALVLFKDGDEPCLYLIPTTAWKEPNRLFVDRVYSTGPEYGLNLSKRDLSLLQPFAFSERASTLA